MTQSPVAGSQVRAKGLINSAIESLKITRGEAQQLISSDLHVPAGTIQTLIDCQELLRVWEQVARVYQRNEADEQRLYAALLEWMDNAREQLVDGRVSISSSLVASAISMAEEQALRAVVKQLRLKVLKA